MIFHLVVNHRHSVTFLSNANSYFDPEKHRFLLLPTCLQPYDWLKEMRAVSPRLKFLDSISPSAGDCVVLHSLFLGEDDLNAILALKAKNGFSVVWSSWGSDFLKQIRNPSDPVFQNFDCVIVNRSAFQSRRFPESLVVDNDTKFYLDAKRHVSAGRKKDAILVGNSGDPSNNHFEIFEKLDTDYRILIPLGYNCSPQYMSDIRGWAKSVKNATVLERVLDPDAYLEMLDSVRLCVFAHNRQQGIHTARAVYQVGGNVCLKKRITESSGQRVINPGYFALFETGCPDLIDFEEVGLINDDFLETLSHPIQASFFTSSWQEFYFNAFENRWTF